MQGDIISSNVPVVPLLSIQYRYGKPPYPSKQYPSKVFIDFIHFISGKKTIFLLVLSPEVVGGQYAFSSVTERH